MMMAKKDHCALNLHKTEDEIKARTFKIHDLERDINRSRALNNSELGSLAIQKAEAVEEIMSKRRVMTGLHSQCHWLMMHYNRRKQARRNEIKSIKQANGFLGPVKTFHLDGLSYEEVVETEHILKMAAAVPCSRAPAAAVHKSSVDGALEEIQNMQKVTKNKIDELRYSFCKDFRTTITSGLPPSGLQDNTVLPILALLIVILLILIFGSAIWSWKSCPRSRKSTVEADVPLRDAGDFTDFEDGPHEGNFRSWFLNLFARNQPSAVKARLPMVTQQPLEALPIE